MVLGGRPSTASISTFVPLSGPSLSTASTARRIGSRPHADAKRPLDPLVASGRRRLRLRPRRRKGQTMLRWRLPASVFGVLVAIALTVPCMALGAPAPSGAAADGPGELSHCDLARNDCLGTARNRTSKVWFTIAGGMLSDVYFPTEDNTNVETMQYVVARNGAVDLQARDMTYTVRALDDLALSCRVTVTGPDARYRITTDYITDPDRPTVLMRTRFKPLRGQTRDYRLYVRLDPTLNG